MTTHPLAQFGPLLSHRVEVHRRGSGVATVLAIFEYTAVVVIFDGKTYATFPREAK